MTPIPSSIRPGTTPDGAFTYLEAGPPGAPPVVFLHGIGGGARLWMRQLDALSPRWRGIAWNMPGYAGSLGLEAPRMSDLAAALARFLDALGLKRPVLVGHSIGGMIVQEYLAAGLGAPAAIVLAQTTPAFGGRDPAWAEQFLQSRLAPLDAGATMASLAHETVSGMIGDDPDPAGVALAEDAVAATPEDAFRATTLAMLGFDRRAAMAAIAVPTLLISGSRDQNAPAATMAKMAAAIPGSDYECLEGAGHLVMLERPDAVTSLLSGFLDRAATDREVAA